MSTGYCSDYYQKVAALGPLHSIPKGCKMCTVDGKSVDGNKTIIWQNHKRYIASGMTGQTVQTTMEQQKNGLTQFLV